MSSPLVDVAMSYVKVAAPKVMEDETVKEEIRVAFEGYISGQTNGEAVAEILQQYAGNIQALERIEAILNTPETPPPLPRQDYTPDPFQPMRKKTRPWGINEDTRLLAGIHKFGLDNWISVAKFVGNGRTRAQCAQRWVRGLDPRISKDQWSPEDEDKLVSLISANENKGWTMIAAAMGNRSDVQCRYHFLQMQRDGKIPPEIASLMITDKGNPPLPLPNKQPNNIPKLAKNQYLVQQQQFKQIQRNRSSSLNSPSGARAQPFFGQYGGSPPPLPAYPQYPPMGQYPPQMMSQQMYYNQPPTQLSSGTKMKKQRKSASSVTLPPTNSLFDVYHPEFLSESGGEDFFAGTDMFDNVDTLQNMQMSNPIDFFEPNSEPGIQAHTPPPIPPSDNLIDWTNDGEDDGSQFMKDNDFGEGASQVLW